MKKISAILLVIYMLGLGGCAPQSTDQVNQEPNSQVDVDLANLANFFDRSYIIDSNQVLNTATAYRYIYRKFYPIKHHFEMIYTYFGSLDELLEYYLNNFAVISNIITEGNQTTFTIGYQGQNLSVIISDYEFLEVTITINNIDVVEFDEPMFLGQKLSEYSGELVAYIYSEHGQYQDQKATGFMMLLFYQPTISLDQELARFKSLLDDSEIPYDVQIENQLAWHKDGVNYAVWIGNFGDNQLFDVNLYHGSVMVYGAYKQD